MKILKIDFINPETILSALGSLISRALYDLIKSIIKRLRNKRSNQPQKVFQKPIFCIEKFRLMSNIDLLHQIPKFDHIDPTMNRELLNLYFSITIEYLSKYEIDGGELSYISGNHCLNASSKLDLIEKLEDERKNPKQNDSRYYLGFRTLSYLLSENLEELTIEELKALTRRLSPFFSIYSRKRKDYLNHYVSAA